MSDLPIWEMRLWNPPEAAMSETALETVRARWIAFKPATSEERLTQQVVLALVDRAEHAERARDAERTRYVLASAGWKETCRQLEQAEQRVRALDVLLKRVRGSLRNTEYELLSPHFARIVADIDTALAPPPAEEGEG